MPENGAARGIAVILRNRSLYLYLFSRSTRVTFILFCFPFLRIVSLRSKEEWKRICLFGSCSLKLVNCYNEVRVRFSGGIDFALPGFQPVRTKVIRHSSPVRIGKYRESSETVVRVGIPCFTLKTKHAGISTVKPLEIELHRVFPDILRNCFLFS